MVRQEQEAFLMLNPIDGLTPKLESNVLYLTIDRPTDLNRLSPELIDHLGMLITELRERSDIHVVVITGAGKTIFQWGF
ncbi:MAG: hypothetical protein EBQ69_01785 [Betaproteobacteria bacterium]|nr:hypothetical protein [Betaproteobacteria bacterium]